MNKYNTLFRQMLDVVGRSRFNSLVKSHHPDKCCNRNASWMQFLAMLYAQVTDANGLRSIEGDRIIRFTGCKASRDCPDELRLIKSTDPKTGKSIEILTNMKGHSAKFIAGLYKKRWEVELFFKASKHSEIMQMLCVSYYFSLCLLSSSS